MKHPTPPNPPEWLLRVKRARMLDWLGVAALLSVLVWLMAPQQLPVSVYKLSLVAMAAVAGYWLDRSLFPYARPDLFLELHVAEAGKDEAKAVEFFSFTEQHSAEQLSDASRTDQLRLFGLCMLRRASIVAAAMIAVGLGA